MFRLCLNDRYEVALVTFSGSLFQMNGNLVKKECLNAFILEWTQRNIQ